MGSYSYDVNKIEFETKLNSVEVQNNKKHDYISHINYLQEKDTVHFWPSTQANYSIAGFQITFHRHAMKYITQYYVTSALFVCVSWVGINHLIFYFSDCRNSNYIQALIPKFNILRQVF